MQWLKSKKALFFGILIILVIVLIDFYLMKPQTTKEHEDDEDKTIVLTIKNNLEINKKISIEEEKIATSTPTIKSNISGIKPKNNLTITKNIENNITINKKPNNIIDNNKANKDYNNNNHYNLNDNDNDNNKNNDNDNNNKLTQTTNELMKEENNPNIVDKNIFKIVKEPISYQTIKNNRSKPNISYHGFYIMGEEKVAILKKSDDILLTKINTRIQDTNFKLTSMNNEKITIKDISNNIKEYEILISNESE